MAAVGDTKPSPRHHQLTVSTSANGLGSYVNTIENMVSSANEDVVEQLLSERLLQGFLLLERSCPACTTPLVKQHAYLKYPGSRVSPKSPSRIAKIQKMYSREESNLSMSCNSAPRPPAPIAGVPFCVNCKAHVVTHESEIQFLDTEHNTLKHQGKILVDLIPPPSPHPDTYMYETTTITSTSTQFQTAAMRRQRQNGTPVSQQVCAGSSVATKPKPTPAVTVATSVVESPEVVPPTLDEDEDSVVPVPDEEESVAPSPMSAMHLLSSPASSGLLSAPVSERLGHLSPAVSELQPEQEQKTGMDDHENDALIEICDDDEDDEEPIEVIHTSNGSEVVAEGDRFEYAIEKKNTAMTECSSKNSATYQSRFNPSPIDKTRSVEVDVASIHAQIYNTISNLESNAALACKSHSSSSVGKTNGSAAGAESRVSDKMPAVESMTAQPPKLVIETTERTSAMSNHETGDEKNDVLPEYSVIRDIATKVLANKMIEGYSLTEQQCGRCSMPVLEYESKLECAVCPALEKMALKTREKEQRRTEKEAEKKHLADQKYKLEEDIRLRRTKAVEEAEKLQLAKQEAEKLQLAQQEAEKLQLAKQEAEKLQLAKQEAEKLKLAELQAEKLKLAEQQAEKLKFAEQQAEKLKLAEQQAEKLELQAKKLEQEIVCDRKAKLEPTGNNESGSIKSYLTGVRTIKRTPRTTPRSTPTSSIVDKHASLQAAPQPITPRIFSLNPEPIVPPSPRKAAELEADEARLLAELQKAEEEREARAVTDVFLGKEAKLNEAITKGNELVFQETKRLEELERHRIQAMQMPVKGMLADLSAQEQRRMKEEEAVLRKEIETAEKARDEAKLEARRLADEKRAMEEDKLLVALEEEAMIKQKAAEEAMEKAKAAREHVASARREILAKTIADGAAEAVAEAESIMRAEREDYHEQVVLPTGSDLRRERWETLRAEGRSVMTRRIMAGWTLLPEFCRGAECEDSPLLCKHATKMCVVCGGDGIGTNGAYRLREDSDDDDDDDESEGELDFDDDDDTAESSFARPPLEISTYRAIDPTPVVTEDPTGPPSPTQTRSVTQIHDDFETKRNLVCKEIGKRMLQGWTLLDMACPNCVMPLMATPEGTAEICMLCGPVAAIKEDEEERESVSVKEQSTSELLAQSIAGREKEDFDPSSEKLPTNKEQSVASTKQDDKDSKIKQSNSTAERFVAVEAQSVASAKLETAERSVGKVGQSVASAKQDNQEQSVSLSEKIKQSNSTSERAATDAASASQSFSSKIKQYLSAVERLVDGQEKFVSSSSQTKLSQSTAERPITKEQQSVVSVKLSEQEQQSASSTIKHSVSPEIKQSKSTTGRAQSVPSPELFVPTPKFDDQEKSVSLKSKQSHSTAAKDEHSVSSAKLLDRHIFPQSLNSFADEYFGKDDRSSSNANNASPGELSGKGVTSMREKSVVEASVPEEAATDDKGSIHSAETAKEVTSMREKSVVEASAPEEAATDDKGSIHSAETVKEVTSMRGKSVVEASAPEEAATDDKGSIRSVSVKSVKGAASITEKSVVETSTVEEAATDDEGSIRSVSVKSVKGVASITEKSVVETSTVEGDKASIHSVSASQVEGRYDDSISKLSNGSAESVDEHASSFSLPAHLFSSRITYRNQSLRIRGDPPALQGYNRRKSKAVDPEDSRSPPGSLSFAPSRERDVEDNTHKTDTKASPETELQESRSSPGLTPDREPDFKDNTNETVLKTSPEIVIKTSTETVLKTSPETDTNVSSEASPKEAPGEAPADSPKDLHKDSFEDAHKEGRESPNEWPKKESPDTNLVNDFAKDPATKRKDVFDRIESIKERRVDRIESIKERRENALARKMQINASNSNDESKTTDVLELPQYFDVTNEDSFRDLVKSVKGSVKGRDGPQLGIDTNARVHVGAMHLPSPGMTEVSIPNPFVSPAASVQCTPLASAYLSNRASSVPRPRITPESVTRRRGDPKGFSNVKAGSGSSTKSTPPPGSRRGDSKGVSNVETASGSGSTITTPPPGSRRGDSKGVSYVKTSSGSGSTKSTPPPGSLKKMPSGKYREHSNTTKKEQPEVIVIGGPFDTHPKAHPKALSMSGSTKSTPLPGLQRRMPSGTDRGYSNTTKREQPEVIVIGGPSDTHPRAHPKALSMSGSTKSTPLSALQRRMPSGTYSGYPNTTTKEQPEVIVIGGPSDTYPKKNPKALSSGTSTPFNASPKSLPRDFSSGASSSSAAVSIGSATLDALLFRIEETKAQLEETPNTTNRLEQQSRLKALIENLASAAAAVQELDDACE